MPVEIEGMAADEILALPAEHLDALVFTGTPVVSALALLKFWVSSGSSAQR